MFQDIESGLDEEHLSKMHAWWMYDLGRLHASRHLRSLRPRIEMTVGFTSKGNLAVTWEPAGLIADKPGPDCDWRGWWVEKPIAARPSNELLFVRGLDGLLNTYRHHQSPLRRGEAPSFLGRDDPDWNFKCKQWRREYLRERRDIDSALLQLAAALVGHLKIRLKTSFEIKMITEIEIDWKKAPELSEYASRVERWEIVNVAERTRKREEQEHEQLPSELECPLEVFVEALKNALEKGPTGPAPTTFSSDRVARRLKKAGYSKMSVGRVERYKHLVEKLRPDLLDASRVVSLNSRRPQGGAPADEAEG